MQDRSLGLLVQNLGKKVLLEVLFFFSTKSMLGEFSSLLQHRQESVSQEQEYFKVISFLIKISDNMELAVS